MADLKISQLSAATTPLAGTEVLPIVQSGSTKKVTVADLTSGRTVDMAALVVNGTAVQAGYDVTIGNSASAANVYLAASGSGAYLTGVSSASAANGFTIGHITAVSRFQVQVGGTGGVEVSSGGTSWSAMSDERLKDIIEPIQNAVAKVGKLRKVIGKYKTDKVGTRRAFFIAQDFQGNFEEVLNTTSLKKGDKEEYFTVAYTETIPLLAAAIDELAAEIAAIKGAK